MGELGDRYLNKMAHKLIVAGLMVLVVVVVLGAVINCTAAAAEWPF